MGKKVTIKESYYQAKEFTDPVTGKKTKVKATAEITTPVIEGYTTVTLPTKQYFNNGPFCTIFQEPLREIVLHGQLTKTESQLLLYLISSMTRGNTICTDLPLLVEELGIDKGNLVRALQGLEKRNIIVKKNLPSGRGLHQPKVFTISIPIVNPNLSWNGRVRDFKKDGMGYPEILDKNGYPLLNYRENQTPEIPWGEGNEPDLDPELAEYLDTHCRDEDGEEKEGPNED